MTGQLWAREFAPHDWLTLRQSVARSKWHGDRNIISPAPLQLMVVGHFGIQSKHSSENGQQSPTAASAIEQQFQYFFAGSSLLI